MQRRRRPAINVVLCTIVVVALALVAVACRAETTIDASDISETGATAAADASNSARGAVYDQVKDSVVFLSTENSSGSGVVIFDGWILTNAHIVDRLDTIDVFTGDGDPLGTFPVRGVDWIFDLALVGPVAGLEGFERSTSAEAAVGDEVALVGFPDASNFVPSGLTFTSGALANRRAPAVGDASWLLIDATIAPGLSGGAAIGADGRLLAINALEFGEGEFALSLEADSIWPRVDKMLDELDDRAGTAQLINEGESVFELADEVGPLRALGFLLSVEAEGDFAVTVDSEADVWVQLHDLEGSLYVKRGELGDPFDRRATGRDESLQADDTESGVEELAGQVPPGIYQVIVGAYDNVPTSITVTSRNPMFTFHDVEEGATLTPGVIAEGDFDWLQDSDRWLLEVTQGDDVTITADGIADTVMAVRLDGELIASSDDELIGLFGEAASVTFVANETGTYEVEIGTLTDSRWGYLVEVAIN